MPLVPGAEVPDSTPSRLDPQILQITWTSGLGAITHLLGPSDQTFLLAAESSRALRLGTGTQGALLIDPAGFISHGTVGKSGDTRIYGSPAGGTGAFTSLTTTSTGLFIIQPGNGSEASVNQIEFTAHLRSNANDSHDLGETGARWRSIRVGTGTSSYEGLLLSGAQSLHADVTGVAGTPGFSSVKDNNTNFGLANVSVGANAVGPIFGGFKTRSTSSDADTVVNSGDVVLSLVGRGADGAAYQRAAEITFEVDGTPGSGDMPGRIVFRTTPDGSGTPAENLRLTQAGDFGVGTATPRSKLHVNGSQSVKRTAQAADYTVLVTDYYIGITSTAAARTVTLPTVAASFEGKVFVIKDESGGAGTNNITIEGDGAETIDGAANKVINTNYGAVSVICTGSAWMVI